MRQGVITLPLNCHSHGEARFTYFPTIRREDDVGIRFGCENDIAPFVHFLKTTHFYFFTELNYHQRCESHKCKKTNAKNISLEWGINCAVSIKLDFFAASAVFFSALPYILSL